MSSRLSRFAQLVAVWFGCGYAPYAPGTAGTIGALPLYFAVRSGGPVAIAATALVVTAVGIWTANIVANELDKKDPQIVVIDEVAGVLWTLATVPMSVPWVVAGVVAFRVFDMTKPWPARPLERLRGGWGIVLDDVAAGAWAAGVLAIVRLVWPRLHG